MPARSARTAKLKAQTTGTAVITLTYDANNSLAVTFHKVGFSVVQLGDTDGRVTRPEARTSERRPFPGNSADFPLHFYMSRRKLFVEVAG